MAEKKQDLPPYTQEEISIILSYRGVYRRKRFKSNF